MVVFPALNVVVSKGGKKLGRKRGEGWGGRDHPFFVVFDVLLWK